MSEKALNDYLQKKESGFEQICRRCGACCGIDNDPCEKLIRSNSASYHCRDYENRIGLQRTINGKEFHCIQIRELLHNQGVPANCAYLRLSNYESIG